MAYPLKTILTGLVIAFWAGMALAQERYEVQSGDTLGIEVLEDSSLNRTVLVLPDGRINFPFAGSLRVAGLTAEQVETTITSAIQSNFANPPTVFVSVSPRPELREPGASAEADEPTIDIYFVGEVNRPGLVEVAPGTTLLQAVAISGGVSRFAAIKRIQLRRTDAGGVQRVTILNYKALADGAVTTDIELRDGDVILVPERRLFE
jgi:polysaccharide export outer membrane protein